jgi:hypothetical protein
VTHAPIVTLDHSGAVRIRLQRPHAQELQLGLLELPALVAEIVRVLPRDAHGIALNRSDCSRSPRAPTARSNQCRTPAPLPSTTPCAAHARRNDRQRAPTGLANLPLRPAKCGERFDSPSVGARSARLARPVAGYCADQAMRSTRWPRLRSERKRTTVRRFAQAVSRRLIAPQRIVHHRDLFVLGNTLDPASWRAGRSAWSPVRPCAPAVR